MFVVMEKDALSAKFKNNTQDLLSLQHLKGDKENAPIRRPYRGIQIKGDTYAVLKIMRADGSTLGLVSSSAIADSANSDTGQGIVAEYSDFIIQRVDDQRAEKSQIIETFGESFVYFFGERPRIVTFSGVLMNTEDFNWRAQFWDNYEKHIRGTRLVQQSARVYIGYDTIVIGGYPLQAQATDTADSTALVQFSITMLVTDYYDYSGIGVTQYPKSPDTKSLDVLNQELAAERQKFVSTGFQVRQLNLDEAMSGGSVGVLGALRTAVRTANEFFSSVSNRIGAASRALGGRYLRLPVGVAGMLAQAGHGGIAAGSIAEGAGTLSMFDRVTGQTKGLLFSLKMRVPAYATFTSMPRISRGYFSDNYDEYPTRSEPQMLSDISPMIQANAEINNAIRALALKEENLAYGLWAGLSEADAVLGDIIQVANFVKSNFGMIMTGVQFIKAAKEHRIGEFLVTSLGLSEYQSAITSGSRVGKGLPPGVQAALDAHTAKYVGSEAVASFTRQTNKYRSQVAYVDPGLPPPPTPPEAALLGSVYQDSTYQKKTDRGTELSLEAVYQGKDYSSVLVSKNVGFDDPEHSTTQVIEDQNKVYVLPDNDIVNSKVRLIEDQNKVYALSEAYGDVDIDGEPPATAMAVAEVYTTPAPVSPSDHQLAASLGLANEVTPPASADSTSGIRGRQDDIIEPVK